MFRTLNAVLVVLLVAIAAVVLYADRGHAAPGDTIADRVFGQAGSFTTSTANNGGVSASSLARPTGMAMDSAGRLYVAEADNNRVLEYDTPLTSQTATRVFGQAGSFTTNTANNGGVSASSLSEPLGVAVDSAGRLYVVDFNNHRVLEYDSPLTSQTATRVFGQGGSFTTNTGNNGGVSASSLFGPIGMAVDSAGRLYVADANNYRVLEYDSPLTSQTATRVFGQAGSFTSNSANNGGISASSLDFPVGMAFGSAGRLYVADAFNNRVLEYDTPLTSQTATRVFGQASSFTTNTANNGGISASSLFFPEGLAVDSAGRLYVSEVGNNRVLEYDTPLTSQTATRVFGQAGSFTTNTDNFGSVSASSLSQPSYMAVDSAGDLYVADASDHRVLEYDTPASPSTTPTSTSSAGQPVGGITDLEQPASQGGGDLASHSASRAKPETAMALAAGGMLVLGIAGWYLRRKLTRS